MDVKSIIYILFARRFVAGEHMDQAIDRTVDLEREGFGTIINVLGESVDNTYDAERFTREYCELALALAEAGSGAHIAVKLTQIGLLINEDLCFENLMKILRTSSPHCTVVEIDREAHEYHGATRRVIDRISYLFRNLVRVCVQLNHEGFYEEICSLAGKWFPVRVCKGAYSDGDISSTQALRNRMLTVARNFYNKPALGDSHPAPIAYATHDFLLLERIPPIYTHHQDFELQLLMGIETGYARQLLQQGYAVRLYVPYGPNWLPYGQRRLTSIFKIYLRNLKYRIRKR